MPKTHFKNLNVYKLAEKLADEIGKLSLSGTTWLRAPSVSRL